MFPQLRTSTRVLLTRLSRGLDDLSAALWAQHFSPPHRPQPALAAVGGSHLLPTMATPDPLSSFDGLLWNTPKRRRSIEAKHRRRFGIKFWGTYKLPRPNMRLRVDHRTGEVFELGKLPLKTYQAVMKETREIQARMAEAFGVEAKDREVAVVYKGEDVPKDADKFKLVEMEKERPAFFAPSLTQRSSRPKIRDESTTTVRPSGLS